MLLFGALVGAAEAWQIRSRSGRGNSISEMRITVKGLILAQNERWRRGLGMQVERELVAILGKVAKGAVRHG